MSDARREHLSANTSCHSSDQATYRCTDGAEECSGKRPSFRSSEGPRTYASNIKADALNCSTKGCPLLKQELCFSIPSKSERNDGERKPRIKGVRNSLD
jgi:hypothetical protein